MNHLMRQLQRPVIMMSCLLSSELFDTPPEGEGVGPDRVVHCAGVTGLL